MSRIGRFETSGPADRGRYRTAMIVDFISGLVLAMLAFPFPIVRAMVSVPVFVGSILVSIVIVHLVYLAVATAVWGRTPGMYLLDLGIAGGRPAWDRALSWALGVVLGFTAIMLGAAAGDPATGLPTRLSGLVVLSSAEGVKEGGEQ